MGVMHFGKLETSLRLQETLAVLIDGKQKTTGQIRRATRSQAVHSDIAGLRKNDILIKTIPLGLRRGRKCYAYEFVGWKKSA